MRFRISWHHPDWCGEYYSNGANARRYAACNNQNEDFVRGIVDENGQREGRVMSHHGSYGCVHEPSDMVGV